MDARQQAWETAMGMRGYAGSAAQREDRRKAAAYPSVPSTQAWELPLTLADAISRLSIGSAMIEEWRGQKLRHLKLRSDQRGHYVRVGKRGTVKKYLTGFKVICREPLAMVFQVEGYE